MISEEQREGERSKTFRVRLLVYSKTFRKSRPGENFKDWEQGRKRLRFEPTMTVKRCQYKRDYARPTVSEGNRAARGAGGSRATER
jgi:hypothetical protein